MGDCTRAGSWVSKTSTPPVSPREAVVGAGAGGINALILHQPPYNLTGYKIGIGQVEIGRPGLIGLDKVGLRNRAMTPTQVFDQDQPSKPNEQVEEHSHNVAAIMISRDKALLGVAPRAKLYSSAVSLLDIVTGKQIGRASCRERV